MSLLRNYTYNLVALSPKELRELGCAIHGYFAANPRGKVHVEYVTLRGRKRRYARTPGERQRLTVQLGKGGERFFVPHLVHPTRASFTATRTSLTVRCRCRFFQGVARHPIAHLWNLYLPA
jgi:hypothetical protein